MWASALLRSSGFGSVKCPGSTKDHGLLLNCIILFLSKVVWGRHQEVVCVCVFSFSDFFFLSLFPLLENSF